MPGDEATVVVLQGDDRQFGLVVDSIEDSQEIVVKPLGRLLSGLPYAGATILGNGQIALILDVFRLGLAAGVVSESRARSISSLISSAVEHRVSGSRLLCVHGPDDERMAVEFEQVSRLEHFERHRIERIGDRRCIQYGDEILPLFDLAGALPERRSEPRNPQPVVDSETAPVVVCTVNGRLVGLVVHRIADIVDESLKARKRASRDGVSACTVIQDRVTEILDLERIIGLADPGFFDQPVETE
jgi:two-component system chemotaxis sensor kinase CheA